MAVKWRHEALRARLWGEQPSRSFEELMLVYLKATQETKRSARDDRLRARKLRDFFAGKDMRTLRPADVRAYIDARVLAGVSPATINRELALLSAAIRYATRELEWELPNPVHGRLLKEPEGRLRWLRPDEAARLLEAARRRTRAPHLVDFIELALNTGCRAGELLQLEWARVSWEERLIVLESAHTKNARRRYVPLNDRALGALRRRQDWVSTHCPESRWVFANRHGERITTLQKSFRSALKEAGITDFRIHDLRHTCAAWLVSAGVPLPEVRDLLGHRSITMTERYAHLAPENVRSAVSVLDTVGRSQNGHTRCNATGVLRRN